MKKFTTAIATTAAAGLSAAVVGLAAPVGAAPSGTGDALETISQLKAGGNRVVVSRLGSTPLSEASVVSIRAGADIKERVRGSGRDRGYLAVVGKVYYVSVS